MQHSIYDKQTGISYILQGDYYLPDLTLLPEEENVTEKLKTGDTMRWV